MFAEITPIPTNKLSVGNVAKLPAEEEAKKSTSCSAVLLNQWQKQLQQIDIKM